MSRPLGEKQEKVLASLRRHKSWSVKGGWIWDTPSGTKKILDSLVARGFAKIVSGENGEDKYLPVDSEFKSF
jgi:hypothetical protein